MTTKELIAELKRLDPSGEGEVRVPVGSYTKVYPSAYLEVESVEQSPHYTGKEGVHDVRIYVSFPEGFQIREMRKPNS
jgi:hypothetical protein